MQVQNSLSGWAQRVGSMGCALPGDWLDAGACPMTSCG